jgi:hypothetical protein
MARDSSPCIRRERNLNGGSGINAEAVYWYLLETKHSDLVLGMRALICLLTAYSENLLKQRYLHLKNVQESHAVECGHSLGRSKPNPTG